MKWLKQHSLSIVVVAIWWTLTAAAFMLPEGPLQNYIHNLAGDAFGASLMVIATKYFIEKGSAESRDDDDQDPPPRARAPSSTGD